MGKLAGKNFSCIAQRVVGQVGISKGGLRASVVQERLNLNQRHALLDEQAGMRMPKVMNADHP